ncbi:MAG: InlB B-repeat-containing protein [Collinsella sp.]|nr:InlB B-repeat-containing protein [Collinsella sp.]
MGVLERNVRDDVGQLLGNAPSADSRRQMDMFEDERERASWRRHGAIARGVAKRGLVAFLAFAMAFGTTPAQLWAEGAEGIAEAVAQAATAGEGAAADDGAAAADTGANGAAVEDGTGTSDAAAVSADAADSSQVAAKPDEVSGDTRSGDASGKVAENANEERAVPQLSSKNGVSVGMSPAPARWFGSNLTGFIQQTTTLYANVWSASSKRADVSGATYQWLAADISNRNDPDSTAFVPVEGQTGASIVLDDALRTQLSGKCLRVRIVDAHGNVVYGPTKRANSQTLTATNAIKAPVPTKTALDAKSYILIQSSADETSSFSSAKAQILRPGTTLWANAYDGEAVPNKRIAAQSGWSYQWLSSETRDADDASYQVITGQTGQSLTITDELADQLAGRYIRVRVVGNGQELYGPSSSLKTPASVGHNTPGPVATDDQIALGHIVLAYNGAGFGDDYENVPNANVGDTIRAAAYYLDYDTPNDLFGSDKVDFSWWAADTADGAYEQVATGDTFTVTEACANRYLKVVAQAKKGIPGSDRCETKPGRILRKGATTLASVEFVNASKGAKDTGSTIEACAYKAVDFSFEPVTEGVTYTWRWSSVNPSSPDFDAKVDWHVVEGKTDGSFTIPDDYAKRWVSVSATAGDNTVEATTAVAVKAAGSHELFLTYLKKVVGNQSDDARFVYKSGEKIGVTAFEKTAAGTKGAELASDQLTYTWQIADNAQGPFTTLTDENAHRPSFVISQKYVGKYLKCIVDGGYNTDYASTRNAIVKGEDAKAYTLTSVNVASSGNLAQVGGTLTPTANYMATGDWGDYETALPEDSLVDYRWYLADDAEGTNAHELFGADETTGVVTLPPSAEGKYAYVVANAGNNDVKSAAWLVNSSDEKSLSVNVSVVGVSKHDVGQSYDFVDWVPSTSFNWSSIQKMSAWDIFAKVLDDAGYSYSTDGGVPYSVTNPDKSQTLAMESTAYGYKYWRFDINGQAANSYATGYYPNDGDTLELVYEDPTGTPSSQVSVTMEIIGKKAEIAQRWTSPSTQVFAKGTSIKDASAAYFDALGIKSKMYDQFGYWGVSSLVSPLDGTELSGAWSFFVNGVPGSQLDSDYVLKSGDKIVWAFAPGDTVPGVDSVVVDPGAARPNWDCDWPGYTSADKVTDAPVPTKDAEAKWVSELKGSDEWNKGISDPLLVGNYLYVAVGSKLLKKNVDTGETVAESPLAAKIDSTSRMVYTGGVILVPLSSGRLQALTVDALATVWVTDELPAGPDGAQQSLASITVRDGYAYFGTASANWTDSSDGYLLCVRISDGKVMWQHKNENSKGYYWAGLAFSGNYGVIADDSGTVSTVDPETGKTVASLKIADRVRTTVLVDGSIAYVVSADGVLHKLSVGADGALSELGKVTFGSSSTSTPVLVNGKIVVGGASTESFMGGYPDKYTYHYGQLAVIDAETLAVDYSICKADGSYIRQGTSGGGDVKSQPVVSVQNGETYVYFTSNNNPGGIYRYRIGDDEAELLYTPAAGDQQYCMASISVGSDGSLYYVNDSGKLFAVKGNGQRAKRYTVTFDANGKDAVMPDSQRVKEGKAATEPSTKPRCKGYTFAGWYTDAACTKAYDFSAAVTADMTLYAKWIKNAVNPGGNGGSGSNGGNGGSGNAGAGSGSGNGTNGQQTGGAVVPGKKPVSSTTTTTETKDDKDSKKKSDKSGKKDKKSGKKDDKSGKSDTGSSAATTVKKSAAAPSQQSGFNPLAIAGVAAGVIGLAVIGVFVFTKRR